MHPLCLHALGREPIHKLRQFQSDFLFLGQSTSLVRDARKDQELEGQLGTLAAAASVQALTNAGTSAKRHCRRESIAAILPRKAPATHLRQDCPRRGKPEALAQFHHRPDSLLDPGVLSRGLVSQIGGQHRKCRACL